MSMRFAANVPGITEFLTAGPDYAATHNLGLRARAAEEQQQLVSNARITGSKIGARIMDRVTQNDIKLLGMQYADAASQAAAAGNQALFGGAGDAIGGAFSKGGMFNFGAGGGGASSYGFDPAGSQGNPFGGTLGRMPLNG